MTWLVVLGVVSLVASACGGKDLADVGKTSSAADLGLTSKDGESGLEEAGEPERGGTLVYGLEADSAGGYCLPEGQLAISGMMVVRAVYDTLTVPNADGGYSPYLAKAVTPNDDYTQWDIELREGIKFHDGTDLDATVVKNNLDAYRGAYPAREPLLFVFVLQNIDTVEVVDDLTVRVTTKMPWVSFPAFLYSSSRLGIMGQAQLDDEKSCDRNLIGTGPFEFESWTPNQKLVAKRNPDYWQIAPDGKPYPYADGIEFRPMPDGDIRVNAIQSGEVNVMHHSGTEDMAGTLRDLRDSGIVNMYVSEDQAEVSFIQLNHGRPPFDDIRMRRALAMGADRQAILNSLAAGVPTLANGPFAPDSIGYVEDPGFPAYDLEEAKKLVDEYVAEGNKAEFTISATPDPGVVRLAEVIQERSAAVGVKVTIVKREQAALINDAIGGEFEAMTFRNYPGGDPDTLHVWFYGMGNPVNFSRVEDEEMNALLDEGRTTADPAARAKIYQDLNRRMAELVVNVWAWYTPWAIVTGSKVHNVLGPPLPGDDITEPGKTTTEDPELQPNPGLATGHSLIGMWIDS